MTEKEFKSLSECRIETANDYYFVVPEKDIKEFIKWVETEIIMKSPKRRQNLIKLKNRVGNKLITK